jgi:hypothetical protein
MKRYIAGLGSADSAAEQALPDGVFLVWVANALHRWHAQKPYFSLLFQVLEPKNLAGRRFSARLYCTTKALWKLNWFLRDFGYDRELLGRDEVDQNKLVGLCGVVEVSHAVLRGASVVNLDGFASQEKWQELRVDNLSGPFTTEVAS